MSDKWFHARYGEGAEGTIEFFASAGIDLRGTRLADVGSGDGAMDLGIARRAEPALLTGFDPWPVSDGLSELAERMGVGGELPECLEFVASEPTRLPAEDASYDHVMSWSAFEHVEEPVSVFSEIRRILRPGGLFFLQIWPLYYSEHGGHLHEYYDDAFPHLVHDMDEVAERLRTTEVPNGERMHLEFRHLNRMTVDDVQRALLAGGLGVRKLELLTTPVIIPDRLMRHPLSALGIGGVKLLAAPLR